MPTLHVVGLPWTQTTKRFLHCAYTQKVVKFCDMMTGGAYRIVLYSGDENVARCDEHVQLFTEDWRVEQFGEWDPNGTFENICFGPEEGPWPWFNEQLLREIRPRTERGDFFAPVTGWSVTPVMRALQDVTIPVEWAVGYPGISFPHRVFESYAWQHHVYGALGLDGHAFDAVIPNFFDPADFAPNYDGGEGYLAFLGRVVSRKGPSVAAAIAERVGMPLYVAGPGVTYSEHGLMVCREAGFEVRGKGLEYIGPVDLEERAKFLAGADALIVPTQYVEPFGGVAIEAMLSGTPVVATDWGAFTETVSPATGRRFRTIAEGAVAVEEALGLDRVIVAMQAEGRYSLDAIRPWFEAYFQRLETLWGDGYYA